jgi:hypothetical protein
VAEERPPVAAAAAGENVDRAGGEPVVVVVATDGDRPRGFRSSSGFSMGFTASSDFSRFSFLPLESGKKNAGDDMVGSRKSLGSEKRVVEAGEESPISRCVDSSPNGLNGLSARIPVPNVDAPERNHRPL